MLQSIIPLLIFFTPLASFAENILGEFPAGPDEHASLSELRLPQGLTTDQVDLIINDTVKKADNARLLETIKNMSPSEKLTYLREKEPRLFQKAVYRFPDQGSSAIINATVTSAGAPRFAESEKPVLPRGDKPLFGKEKTEYVLKEIQPISSNFDLPIHEIPVNPDFGNSDQRPVSGKAAKPKLRGSGKPELFLSDEDDVFVKPLKPLLDDGPRVVSRPDNFVVPRPFRPNIENPLGENVPRPKFEKDGKKIDITPRQTSKTEAPVSEPEADQPNTTRSTDGKGARQFIDKPSFNAGEMLPIEKPEFEKPDIRPAFERPSIRKVRPDFPLPDFKSSSARTDLQAIGGEDTQDLSLAAPNAISKKIPVPAAEKPRVKKRAAEIKQPEFPAFEGNNVTPIQPLKPPEGIKPSAITPLEGIETPDFIKSNEKGNKNISTATSSSEVKVENKK